MIDSFNDECIETYAKDFFKNSDLINYEEYRKETYETKVKIKKEDTIITNIKEKEETKRLAMRERIEYEKEETKRYIERENTKKLELEVRKIELEVKKLELEIQIKNITLGSTI